MELKASSPKPVGLSSVEYVSDPDEKEISDDDDDDRNHKHRRRDNRAQSPERDQLEQVMTRPYRKYNKPFNGHMFKEGAANSHYNSDNDFSLKFDKRRPMVNYSRASSEMDQRFKLNQSFPGESNPPRARTGDNSWYQRDSRFGSVDVSPLMGGHGPISSAMFASTGLANVSNSQSPSWNGFGLIPGIPNGAVDAIHPLGWQSALNPSMNLGIPMQPRQRCRDFEERGFCLRGDMCPMEHGVNRIVIEDVQGLSQFNLPGAGLIPPVASASSTMINRKSSNRNGKHRADDEMFRLDGVTEPIDANSADVYDPDQPLWNKDDSQPLVGAEPSDQLVQSNGVWGRIHSSKHSAEPKEKVDSAKSESKMQEVPVAVSSGKGTSLLGKRFNSEESAPTVGDSASKAQDDIGRHTRRPSQKAQRTLFVNFIPLKDNKREALLAHFRKFGEVIDIYIPSNSERAFVQFSKREQAEAALKAPDAVMGNRFIKMWWANRDSIPDKSTGSGSTGPVLAQGISAISVHPGPSPSIPKRKENLSVSIPKVSMAHAAENSPGNDSKSLLANGPKSSPALQKKLQSLELLEEIRRKQELLDQKRSEFRRQLDKLEKHATGTKGEPAEQASKRLKVGTAPVTVKSGNRNSAEPAAPGAAIMAHESALEPQSLGKSLPGSVQLDFSLPESPSLKRANRPMISTVVDVPATKHHLDIGPTTFKVNPPLPSGLADVDALKVHFSSFGKLFNVELQHLEVEDNNLTTSDPETIDNYSALVSFTCCSAAEDAFRDGKHWNGHNLQFAWAPSEASSKSKVDRDSDIPGNHFHSGGNTSPVEEAKTSDTTPSIRERRETSPSLKDSLGAGALQSDEKSACSAEDIAWKTDTGAIEEEESYIELAGADDDSESSPVAISKGQQLREGEM